jgi:hypothetical protein
MQLEQRYQIMQESKVVKICRALYWRFMITGLSIDPIFTTSRSQWPRGLRHELSSPAQTLRSWVRIPLEAWMSLFILFVLPCVLVEALRWADHPFKESY